MESDCFWLKSILELVDWVRHLLLFHGDHCHNTLGSGFDVLANQTRSAFTVVRGKRRKNRAMFLPSESSASERLFSQSRKIGEHHRGKSFPHLVQRMDEVRTSAGRVDQLVKPTMEITIQGNVESDGMLFNFLESLLEFCQFFRGDIFSGITGSHSLHKRATSVQVLQVVEGEVDNPNAAIRHMFDQSFSSKVLERFAHRHLAHAKLLRQLFLTQPFTGFEFTGVNGVAQLLGDDAPKLGLGKRIGLRHSRGHLWI